MTNVLTRLSRSRLACMINEEALLEGIHLSRVFLLIFLVFNSRTGCDYHVHRTRCLFPRLPGYR